MTIRKKRFIYFISKNNKIQIWFKFFSYSNNIYIIKTFKLVTSIDLNKNKLILLKYLLIVI